MRRPAGDRRQRRPARPVVAFAALGGSPFPTGARGDHPPPVVPRSVARVGDHRRSGPGTAASSWGNARRKIHRGRRVSEQPPARAPRAALRRLRPLPRAVRRDRWPPQGRPHVVQCAPSASRRSRPMIHRFTTTASPTLRGVAQRSPLARPLRPRPPPNRSSAMDRGAHGIPPIPAIPASSSTTTAPRACSTKAITPKEKPGSSPANAASGKRARPSSRRIDPTRSARAIHLHAPLGPLSEPSRLTGSPRRGLNLFSGHPPIGSSCFYPRRAFPPSSLS